MVAYSHQKNVTLIYTYLGFAKCSLRSLAVRAGVSTFHLKKYMCGRVLKSDCVLSRIEQLVVQLQKEMTPHDSDAVDSMKYALSALFPPKPDVQKCTQCSKYTYVKFMGKEYSVEQCMPISERSELGVPLEWVLHIKVKG